MQSESEWFRSFVLWHRWDTASGDWGVESLLDLSRLGIAAAPQRCAAVVGVEDAVLIGATTASTRGAVNVAVTERARSIGGSWALPEGETDVLMRGRHPGQVLGFVRMQHSEHWEMLVSEAI